MTLYKLISLAIGVGLIALAAFWIPDPDSGAAVLAFGATLVFLGSTKQVSSEEDREWQNENQK